MIDHLRVVGLGVLSQSSSRTPTIHKRQRSVKPNSHRLINFGVKWEDMGEMYTPDEVV